MGKDIGLEWLPGAGGLYGPLLMVPGGLADLRLPKKSSVFSTPSLESHLVGYLFAMDSG